MLLLRSTVQIWRSTCRGFKGQALYTRRENPWFCVVNRAETTAKTPMGFLIIHFFLYYYKFHCIHSRRRHVAVLNLKVSIMCLLHHPPCLYRKVTVSGGLAASFDRMTLILKQLN